MTVLLVLLGTILALPTTNAQLVFQEEAADPDFKTLIKTFEPGKKILNRLYFTK